MSQPSTTIASAQRPDAFHRVPGLSRPLQRARHLAAAEGGAPGACSDADSIAAAAVEAACFRLRIGPPMAGLAADRAANMEWKAGVTPPVNHHLQGIWVVAPNDPAPSSVDAGHDLLILVIPDFQVQSP